MKYKPNQDWNHAWGAAPANLLPRFVLGAEALTPGWTQVRIRPHIGNLRFAKGKVPTPRGPITVSWDHGNDFQIDLVLPDGVEARLELPAPASSTVVMANGKPAAAKRVGVRWILDQPVKGRVRVEVKSP
jgi:hypothetical protein